jgi:putative molybdopterin biosynthesis protein
MAGLVHRAETFLLESLGGGFAPGEVETAFRMALERWQVLEKPPAAPAIGAGDTLRFAGSHDLAVMWLAEHFGEIAPGWRLEIGFNGSLGGLFGLAGGQCHLCGCHLWDVESGTYNAPFVRRLLPGRRAALVCLAHRRLGWITAPGSSLAIHALADLFRPGVQFANRQPGSGTRVWLDAQLQQAGLDAAAMVGYTREFDTHSAVARAIAEGQASVGLGLQAAAQSFGLDFTPALRERYDLVIPAETWQAAPAQKLAAWLKTSTARQVIGGIEGYEAEETGKVIWVG